jgi:hypothetical protein
MRLMTLIKLGKLFEVSPTHYCTGDVVYLIPLIQTIPGIQYSIDVVVVNYTVFAISI